MLDLVVTLAVDAIYESNSKLARDIDFGEFHPSVLDDAPVILECNKEHMELIHDVYGG